MSLAAYPLFAFLFGSPLAALAAAGAAVSVPIIIHLLNRRRFKVITWAAMRFLLAAQQKNSRKMRLEQLLLLVLRCFIVFLLILAMASIMPWAELVWRALFPESIALAAASARRTHKIVVVDGSFSMATRIGEVTAFDRARALAEKLVRESPRGDGFSVVLMSAPPRRIVPEPSEDGGRVAREIQGLRLPHGNSDLVATLNTVESLLRVSPEKFEEREIYFLTDLQASTWLLKQPGTVTAVLQKIQAKARTVFVDVGQDGLTNLAVTSLTLGEPLATVGALLPINVTVHNFSPESRENVRLELWVGKARSVPGDSTDLRLVQPLTVRVNPGSNPYSFAYKCIGAGDYLLQVRVDGGDPQPLDDIRSAVLTVRNTVRVLLVDGNPNARDPFESGSEWLRLSLNPFDPRPAPPGFPFRLQVLNETQFADAGLGDLSEVDCVFFCDVARLSAAEVRRLETHLRRGGGAVFGLGERVDLGSYNESLYRNGQGVLPARLTGKQIAPRNVHFHFDASEQSAQEPPLNAFARDADRSSLMAGRFWQYIRATPADRGGARRVLTYRAAAQPVRGAVAPALDGLPTGDPALVEWIPPTPPPDPDKLQSGAEKTSTRYRGHVVLYTSTFNRDWTSWPTSPSYPALWQEMTRLAVGGRLREQALQVGEAIEELLPTTGAALDVAFTLPDNRKETVRTQPHDDASVLRFLDTDVSGVYRALVGQHPQEHLYAVNVPASAQNEQATECDPARANKEMISKIYPEWEFQLVTDLSQVSHSGGPTSGPEMLPRPMGPSVARVVMLTVLILVILEVILAWRFGHYSVVAANEAPPATGVWLPGGAAVLVVLALLILGGPLLHAAWTGDFLGFLPETLRRGAEAGLGIPAPASGEGSLWRLEFASYLYDVGTDPWIVGLLAAGGTAGIFWIYRQEGRTAGPAYKALLTALRACLLLMVLGIFLPQLTLSFERQGWPDVVILIDDSYSMNTSDYYQEERVRTFAEGLTREANLPGPERLRLAQALMTRPEADWLTTLLTQRKAKVHVYRCSARAVRLADLTEPHQVEEALRAIRALQSDPTHDSSQLGSALRQVLNDFRGSSLAGVIMLTDGVTTEGEDLTRVSRYASQMGVPLFFVGLGDSHEARDLYLHDLQAEDSVYVNDRLVFELRLTGIGYPDLSVPVELYEKGKKEPLKKEMVRVDPSGRPVKVRLIHQPKEEGEKVFEVRVPVQEGEANPENNVLERTVFVRKAKLIKVLYVEGEARWEYRYVKALLERESARVEGNKSIDLKVLLLEADPEWPAQDRSALAEFPPKAELNQFDVVILGDVDPKPGPRTPRMTENLQNLADFVKERGGGLLMIAGPQFAPHAYKGTPLQDVLPVDITGERPVAEPQGGLVETYRPELTPVGQLHPIFRFSPDEKENVEIWNNLREMFWHAEGYHPKRAAEALAVHPRLRRAGAALVRAESAGPEGHPLVLQQFFGAGRALFFGFEETWRWRWREEELRFNQFWVQTVRYLARSRSGRVELRLDKQTPYRRGEPIRITARFPDDSPPPEGDIKVTYERKPLRGGNAADVVQTTVALARLGERETKPGEEKPVRSEQRVAEYLLTQTPEGDYSFWLSSPVVPGVRPRVETRVLAPPGEAEVLRMNQADMVRAAEESQGRFYSLPEAERVLADLPTGSRVTLSSSGPPMPLWNQSVMFALALGFLTMEWVLRKRKHML